VPLDAQLKQLDINLRSVIHGCHAAASRMSRAGGGQIVNIASLAGRFTAPGAAVYSATKAAVLALSDALDAELAAEGVRVSVDTWKPVVARAALAAGAEMINDVSGLRDVGLADACAEAGRSLVVMHTRAEPKVKAFPDYDDVVADVVEFVRERVELALSHGVARERIVVDPGPDFAKTPAQTVEVLRGMKALRELGYPVLLAVSRKDFIGALTERPPRERDAGTLAAIGAGVDAGAAILRVHDVAATVDYLKVRAALAGEEPVDPDLRLPDELRRQRAA
jgi:dihydropteroate synthase